jgi:hypothetical protein
MKKTTRRRSPGITYRMEPKRLVDQHTLAPGTVLIDRVFDRKLGRFRNPRPEDQIEGNFYLDPEAQDAPPPTDARQKVITAAVEATLDAVASKEQRRRPDRDQATSMVVRMVLTGDAIRAIFENHRPARRRRRRHKET